MKMKENKNIDKYLDLAKGLKKQWNMKVTVIPIVVDVFVTVLKDLGRNLEELEKKRKNLNHTDLSIVKIS